MKWLLETSMPTLITSAILALVFGAVIACTPDPRQETAGTDRRGDAMKVRLTCYESGMKVFDMDIKDSTYYVPEGGRRCFVVKHPQGNIYACGGFCQVVPLQ